MANSGTHAERVADKLVEYLFNPKVLKLPQVSPAKIAEVAGDAAPVIKDGKLEYKSFSRITVWRWLKAMHLDEKSIKDKVEPLAPEKVSDFLISSLSFKQAENLYEWARAKRFDQQKPVKRTTAKGAAKRQTRAKAAEEAAAKAKAAQKALAQAKEQPAKRVFPEVSTSYGPDGKILNKSEVGTRGLARAVEKGIITKVERHELVWALAEGRSLTGLSEGVKYGYAVLTADTRYFNTTTEPRRWAYRQVLGYLTADQRAKLEQAKAGHKSGDKALDAIAETYNKLG